jgi:hypothetical protein
VQALDACIEAEIVNLAADRSESIANLAGFVTKTFAPHLTISNLDGPIDPRHYIFSNEKFKRLISSIPWTALIDGLHGALEADLR